MTLDGLLAGLTDRAIIDAAARFAAGDVPGQSKTFPPTGPEFVAEVRKVHEIHDRHSRPRIAGPTYQRGPLAPFQVAKQKALAAHSHRPVLFEDVNFDQFRAMCRENRLPLGSNWVASLGVVYGPASNSNREAA